MNDSFKHHSDDWSRVPRPEAPSVHPQGYGLGSSDTIKAFTSGRYGQQVIIRSAPEYVRVKPEISVGIAYLLWLLLGLLGAHYFYMGKIGMGVLWLLTGGLLGVGWFIDLFTLKGQVDRLNGR